MILNVNNFLTKNHFVYVVVMMKLIKSYQLLAWMAEKQCGHTREIQVGCLMKKQQISDRLQG